MRVLGLTLTACLVLALAACSGGSDKKGKDGKSGGEGSNANKIVGKWELVKSGSGGDVGSTLEFAKDGKLKMTTKPILSKDKGGTVVGKEETVKGTYTIEGNKITMKGPGGGMSEAATIKTLTDTTLVTVDSNGKTDEFKKK